MLRHQDFIEPAFHEFEIRYNDFKMCADFKTVELPDPKLEELLGGYDIKCKKSGKTDAQAKANARTHFCNTYGKNGQCYGDSGGIIPDPIKAVVPFGSAIPDKQVKQNLEHPAAYRPNNSNNSSSASRLPSLGGTSASKNCSGCNPGDLGCEVGKFSCELTNGMKDWWNGMGESFGKGFSEFGMLPMMALGLGGLIVIAIIMKR